MFAQPETGRVVDEILGLLERWIPLHAAAGKARLTVAIGCTGGQHRSVAIAERLALRLGERFEDVAPVHRDLEKNRSRRPTDG